MLNNHYVDLLNSKFSFFRLSALKKLAKNEKENENYGDSACLFVHTNYSFSPYSPSLAAFMAHKFGLGVIGIMDNYTLVGAKEFIKASKILNMNYVTGVEIRSSFDLDGISAANISIMGIAYRYISKMQEGLLAYRDNQKSNIMATVEAVNKRFKKFGIHVDYGKDVACQVKKVRDRVFLSKYVYFALSKKLVEKFSHEEILKIFDEMGFALSPDQKSLVLSENNPYYVYDLAGLFFEFRANFYSRKSYKDCGEAVSVAHSCGAICAFQYVFKENLVFSEQTFATISENLKKLKNLGFDGVCFDPCKVDEKLRNAIFDKLSELEMLPFVLCDIEFPRQDFCFKFPDKRSEEAMNEAAFVALGNEMSENLTSDGFVSWALKDMSFSDKVKLYAKIGMGK